MKHIQGLMASLLILIPFDVMVKFSCRLINDADQAFLVTKWKTLALRSASASSVFLESLVVQC